MKMTMKNIHVLSTDKPSRLYFDVVVKELLLQNRVNVNPTSFPIEKRHIYITNSEEIKEGQNYIEDGFSGKNKFKWHKSQVELYPNIKKDKIILTTDKSLDGVQAIDDEFLEWFVKNPSCEKVKVESIFEANPEYKEGTQLTEKVGYWSYKTIIPKQKTQDRIMFETSEETKQKAKDYGNSLVKKDRNCTHNCSTVCGECQILEPKPLLSVEWLLRYIEDLNNKGYTFIPSSNKEIVEHIKQMEKDNMIAFLKFVFQQDGFDYEQAYNNFLKQQIL
jgi:hypothetical protein